MIFLDTSWSDLAQVGLPLELLESDHKLWLDQSHIVHLGPCTQAGGKPGPRGINRTTRSTLDAVGSCRTCSARHPELNAMDHLRVAVGGSHARVSAAAQLLADTPDPAALREACYALLYAVRWHELRIGPRVAVLTSHLPSDKAQLVQDVIDRERQALAVVRIAFRGAWVAHHELTGPEHLILIPQGVGIITGDANSSQEVMDVTTAVFVGSMTRLVGQAAFAVVPDPTGAPWWKDAYEDFCLEDLGLASEISEDLLTAFASMYHPSVSTDTAGLLEAARTVVTA